MRQPQREGVRRMAALSRYDSGIAARPPEAVAQRLQLAYRATVDQWREALLAVIVADWHRNPVAFGPGGDDTARADASGWVTKKLREAERLMVGAPADEIARAASKANEQNAKQVDAQLGQLIGSRKEKFKPGRLFKDVTLQRKRLITIGLRQTHGVVIDQFRSSNVDRITSLRAEQIEKVRALLEEGETSGWTGNELRNRLSKDLDIATNRAELIARDQTLKLAGQLTQARQTESGIRQYIWRTAGDERVRGTPGGKWPRGMHYELDGTLQNWSDPPETNENGDRNHPGQDFQCRCTPEPVLPDIDDLPDAEPGQDEE